MTSLARKLQKIFATNATSDVRNFGGLAAGSISYSQDPDVIQSLGAFLTGWKDAVVGNHSPSLQDMDSLFFLLTYQLAYLTQRGMAQYLATQTYDVNDMCLDPAGTGMYVSQQTNNIGHALNNPTWWLPYSSLNPSRGAAKAFIAFAGSNGAAFNGFNCSLVRNSTGNYTATCAAGWGNITPIVAGLVGGSLLGAIAVVSTNATQVNFLTVGLNNTPTDFGTVYVAFFA